MERKYSLFFILLFMAPLWLVSQETNVDIIIKPADSFIKINNEVVDLSKTDGRYLTYLDAGSYEIEIWSPNKKKLIDTIVVAEGEITRFYKTINQFNEAYLDKLRELQKYKLSKFGNTALATTLGIVNLGIVAYVVTPVNKMEIAENLRLAGIDYDNAVASDEIAATKNTYENLQKKFDRRKKLKYSLGVPLLITSVGTSLYYYIHKAKNKREAPEEYKDKNPFLSHDLQLDMINNWNSNGFVLTYKTKF